jgi:hypothetical protein
MPALRIITLHNQTEDWHEEHPYRDARHRLEVLGELSQMARDYVASKVRLVDTDEAVAYIEEVDNGQFMLYLAVTSTVPRSW